MKTVSAPDMLTPALDLARDFAADSPLLAYAAAVLALAYVARLLARLF